MASILLVEPDTVVSRGYSRILAAAGHSVSSADSAQAAISATENDIDLIILELQLGKHNGVELLHELRSYDDLIDLPVIALTNVKPDEFYVSAQSGIFGISQYLYKPKTRPRDLLQAVERVVTVRS